MTAQYASEPSSDRGAQTTAGAPNRTDGASVQARILQRISRIVIRPTLNVLISMYGILITVGPKGAAKAHWIQSLVGSSDYLAYPLRPVQGSSIDVLMLPGCRPRIERVCGPAHLDRGAGVLYFHGGGLVAGGFHSHRRMLSRLSAESLAPVYSVEYRLAIKHEFTDAVSDGFDAYRALLADGLDPAKVVLGGDSGGAAVTLGAAIAIKDAGLPMPAGLIMLSPWVDFDPTVKLADPRAKADPAIPIRGAWPIAGGTLMAEHVLAQTVAEAAEVSPIRGDLSGLCPVLIHCADTEVLAVDALALHEKLFSSGVASELKLWAGQIHAFQLAADLVPEARQSLAELGTFVSAVTSTDPESRDWLTP